MRQRMSSSLPQRVGDDSLDDAVGDLRRFGSAGLQSLPSLSDPLGPRIGSGLDRRYDSIHQLRWDSGVSWAGHRWRWLEVLRGDSCLLL